VTGSQPGSRGERSWIVYETRDSTCCSRAREDSYIYCTREAVRTLKCPIRERDKVVHHDGYAIHQQGMME
jgi:hypothetical protein